MRKKHCDTVVAQVHALLKERYADEQAFTQDDVKRHIGFLEDGKTNRINAALRHLEQSGAVVCAEKGLRGHRCAVFIANAETLELFKPKMLSVKLGYTKPGRKKKRAAA